MKKKPTKKETKNALDNSIEHWEDNVLKLKTLKGKFCNPLSHMYFKIGKSIIPYGAMDCDLCLLNDKYYGLNMSCEDCILTIKGHRCGDSVWVRAVNSKTRKEALKYSIQMLNLLKKVRKELE